MTDFTIKLAGKVISISSNFETTKEYCKDYLAEGKADFSIIITKEDLKKENEYITAPPSSVEIMSLYRNICSVMPVYNTVLFHGSAWCYNGYGYVFTAKSGTGKSTHGEKWQRLFGAEAINDDKPLITVGAPSVVWGTPWMGKHRRGKNSSCPIKAFCLIERSGTNRIEKLSAKDGFDVLIKQSFIPSDSKNAALALPLVIKLSQTVPVYRLFCNMDDEAAMVSFGELTK